MACDEERHRRLSGGAEAREPAGPMETDSVRPLTRPGSPGGAERETELSADQLHEEIAGLRRALASRPTIDMARGIVMATAACTPEDAWRMLVQVSQRSNTKLRDVARHIVESAHGPKPPAPVRAALRAVYTARAGRQ